MNDKKRYKDCHCSGYERGNARRRCGPSSFWVQDSELVFNALKLKAGDIFLDLGCGSGDYSLYAAKIVGDAGLVYAIDVWPEILEGIDDEACGQGLMNIRTIAGDIRKTLSIGDNCVDVCLLATVLHTLNLMNDGPELFSQIRRVLKKDGSLFIIECKKKEMPFGPPVHVRIAAKEAEEVITAHGFEKIGYTDLGCNYMIQFRPSEAAAQ